MKEEILNEIEQLQERVVKLEREYKIYSEHSEEESEPIKYNIDTLKWEIEKSLKPIKEELTEKEKTKNNKIEEITKEAEERIQRLEREYKIYSEHSEEESEPIKYNIDTLKWELQRSVQDINKQFEEEKENILSQIEKTGIDLEEYGLKEPEKKEVEVIEKEEKKEEKEEKEDETKIVNPIISDQSIQTHEPKVVNVGEGKAKTTFTGQELRTFTKDEDIEIIDLNKEEKKINENSEAVRIFYSAKTDKYIVTNVKTGEQKIVERKNIEKLDRNLLAEKMGKDLNNVDTNILQLLISYDEKYKTTKANDYIETLSKIGINKEQRQNEMKENQIEIEYNLKGLYNKKSIVGEDGLYTFEDNFSKEEREELLQIANNAKTKGIATVKKGIKVTVMELFDKIVRKISPSKLLKAKKVSELPKGVEDRENNTQITNHKNLEKVKEKKERKAQLYSGKVNGEYWSSIDKKEYNATLNEIQREKKFKEKMKLQPDQMENRVNMNEEIEKIKLAGKEKVKEYEK